MNNIEQESTHAPERGIYRPLVYGISVDNNLAKVLEDVIWVEKSGNNVALSLSASDFASAVPKGSIADVGSYVKAVTPNVNRWDSGPLVKSQTVNDAINLKGGLEKAAITVRIVKNENMDTVASDVMLTRCVNVLDFTYRQVNEILRNSDHPYNGFLKEYIDVADSIGIKSGMSKEIWGGKWMNREFILTGSIAIAEYFKSNNLNGLFFKGREWDREEEKEGGDGVPYFFDTELTEDADRLNYLRITSPRYKYDSQVNQRILFSHLVGEEAPYTHDELKLLARNINIANNSYILNDEERGQHLKRKMSAIARKQKVNDEQPRQALSVLSRTFHSFPKYEVYEVGTFNNAGFICDASVVIRDHEYEAKNSMGKSKNEAMDTAARNLLNQITIDLNQESNN